MQGLLQRTRDRIASNSIPNKLFPRASLPISRSVRRQSCAALARPTRAAKAHQPNQSRLIRPTDDEVRPGTSRKPVNSSCLPPPGAAWEQDERLGQHLLSDLTGDIFTSHAPVARASTLPDDLEYWDKQLVNSKRSSGDEGAWEVVLALRDRQRTRLLCFDGANRIRDSVLDAAVQHDDRLATILEMASQLRALHKFAWPDLYIKIMHSLLEQRYYERALQWHERLSDEFSPSPEEFGALLSTFVIDATPGMQSTLTSLYVFYGQHNQYDHVIPRLFSSGQSKLARTWRNKFLAFDDLPKSSTALDFLRFMNVYYPRRKLLPAEMAVLGPKGEICTEENGDETHDSASEPQGTYGDTRLAKWFASTWLPVELVINLAHQFGVQMIGPLSLQSLALREVDARGVADNLARLEKRDLKIAPRNYCKVLVFFAKNGKDDLLSDLLHCDIHPDEFDDVETRLQLMAASVRQRDWRTEKLLQGVEWALDHSPRFRLGHMLDAAIEQQPLERVKRLLDRMEAMKIDLAQKSANKLIDRLFADFKQHPDEMKNRMELQALEDQLDETIDVIRRIAIHDVAIPIKRWRKLLIVLGRLGRFEELAHLCLEIVQLYRPPYGGLVPVHPQDMPQHAFPDPIESSLDETSWDVGGHDLHGDNEAWNGPESGNGTITHGMNSTPASFKDVLRPSTLDLAELHDDWSTDFIPADLSFKHPYHPVRRIFTPRLQRAIIRWGIDQTLRISPHEIPDSSAEPHHVRQFDIASGVRILALLKARGVMMEESTIRLQVIRRLALHTFPARGWHRDRGELEMETAKQVIDEAWGSKLLPARRQLVEEIREQRYRMASRYQRLYERAFDY